MNEIVTHTSNRNFEQKLLSNWTIPVLLPEMKPGIDQGIVPIVLAPQTLLTPATKEVVVDTASGSAWINRTPWRVSTAGVKPQATFVMLLALLNLPSQF